MLKFGEIFWIKKHPYASKHWGVVLYADKIQNEVYFQVLNSRMFYVFPNFGSFSNFYCFQCSTRPNADLFLKSKKHESYVDIDTVTFLNYKRYFEKFGFLQKETYICVEKIKRDNLFDFEQNVQAGNYLPQGRLFTNNQRWMVIAASCSRQLSEYDKTLITGFWTATKD